jgi:hypothetical protein
LIDSGTLIRARTARRTRNSWGCPQGRAEKDPLNLNQLILAEES